MTPGGGWTPCTLRSGGRNRLPLGWIVGRVVVVGEAGVDVLDDLVTHGGEGQNLQAVAGFESEVAARNEDCASAIASVKTMAPTPATARMSALRIITSGGSFRGCGCASQLEDWREES